MATKELTIGGQKVEVQEFRGLKGILAIAAVTRIGREVPDVLAKVVREYRGRNSIIVTEPMRRMPAFSGFSTEDFDAAEKKTGKREIELPAPMDQNEQIMQALPELVEGTARKEVIRLLSLLITPNEKLEEADESGTVDELLNQHRQLLLYRAGLDELADLIMAAQSVLRTQLSDKGELGKLLRGLWNSMRRGRSTPLTPTLATEVTTEVPEPIPVTLPTSKDESPTSSTASPPLTDGAEDKLSTASPGVS